MADKSKRELKKEQEVKEENIKKFNEQVELNKKIPDEYKNKINKKSTLSILIAFFMVIYLASINVLSLFMETKIYLIYIKVLSFVLCGISIVYFELGYRKDNEGLFLYGVEVFVLAVVTLFSNYLYYIFFDRYNAILTGIIIIVVVYYIIKTLIIRRKMKKQYYKEQNDIREIVKKD